MEDIKLVKMEVSNTELPVLNFRLSSRIPGDSFLRLKASGTAMLQGLEIINVRAKDSKVSLPLVHRFSRQEMQNNWMWHIRTMSMAVLRVTEELPSGSVLEVSASYRSTRRQQYSGLSWSMNLGTVDNPQDLDLQEIADPVEIQFVSGPAERIEAYLKPNGSLLIEHFDSCGNPTDKYTGKLRIKTEDEEIEVQSSAGVAATRVELPGRYSVMARAKVKDAHDRRAVSNAWPAAMDGTPIFFGECHWHTDFSGDGQRSMEDALKSARDELGLDFAGPADHMGANGRYGKNAPEEQAAICRNFDEPGRFCTIPGAELSKRYGHANIYADSFDLFVEITNRFPKELAPAWNKEPNRYDFRPLVDLCPPGRAIVVPHHTNMDSYMREEVVREDGRPFWCAMHWPIPADRRVVRLFEMVQTRGCFETEETDEQWRIYNGGLGGSARTALMRGYRLGFIGGTDNHCGWPTRQGAGYCGLTAVQADSLDTQTVFNAVYDRRCYATSGARIVADATLNGYPIGSELKLEPGQERKFQVRIQGTAPIAAVQIIHCGYVLADLSVEADQLDFVGEWVDERPGRPLEDTYYYVRARQTDGHCVWLSPFWVDLP
ncbi:CehA/McbA family metallohydrolase [Candidatus Poribacteria bacterium]